MKKIFFLIFALFVFMLCSCDVFLSTYTAINNSSYTVEFTIDGDYKILAASESFTEKRYNSAKVELLNDVPVTVNAGFDSVIFENKTTIKYSISVLNSLTKPVILQIGTVFKEIQPNEEIFLETDLISPILLSLKDNPNYEIPYTIELKDSVYYICIH